MVPGGQFVSAHRRLRTSIKYLSSFFVSNIDTTGGQKSAEPIPETRPDIRRSRPTAYGRSKCAMVIAVEHRRHRLEILPQNLSADETID
ncbi:hypothetical protein PT974_07411 [Cladobotryum mycophilum]|uniref:Uncharacterized protein n=1 Tax=Cladobotryum mycophilum TaxID=491253 RepID=A0ABR0SP66_9HYPO